MNTSLRADFANAETESLCALFDPCDDLLLIHKC